MCNIHIYIYCLRHNFLLIYNMLLPDLQSFMLVFWLIYDVSKYSQQARWSTILQWTASEGVRQRFGIPENVTRFISLQETFWEWGSGVPLHAVFVCLHFLGLLVGFLFCSGLLLFWWGVFFHLWYCLSLSVVLWKVWEHNFSHTRFLHRYPNRRKKETLKVGLS